MEIRLTIVPLEMDTYFDLFPGGLRVTFSDHVVREDIGLIIQIEVPVVSSVKNFNPCDEAVPLTQRTPEDLEMLLIWLA